MKLSRSVFLIPVVCCCSPFAIGQVEDPTPAPTPTQIEAETSSTSIEANTPEVSNITDEIELRDGQKILAVVTRISDHEIEIQYPGETFVEEIPISHISKITFGRSGRVREFEETQATNEVPQPEPISTVQPKKTISDNEYRSIMQNKNARIYHHQGIESAYEGAVMALRNNKWSINGDSFDHRGSIKIEVDRKSAWIGYSKGTVTVRDIGDQQVAITADFMVSQDPFGAHAKELRKKFFKQLGSAMAAKK